MTDHDYDLKAVRVTHDDGDTEEIEVDEATPKGQKINLTTTSIKSKCSANLNTKNG